MQNNGKEIYKQIGSTGELRNELNLSEDILLPEIAQTVAFTREEWTQLQREIAGQEGFQISEIIKAKLSEKIKLSTAAQESSVRARTGMRTEALRENLDKETDLQKIHGTQSKEILSLKIAESIESQKPTINLLKTTLVSIIQKLLVDGVKAEDVNSISKLITIDTGRFSLNETQSAALLKLKEINSNKSTPIYNYFESSWGNMLGNVGEKTGEIKSIRDAYNSGKPIDKNSIMAFASEHPVVTGVVVVAGAYGLYKAFDAIFGDDDNSSKSSTSGETKKGDGFFDKLFEMIPGSSHWKGILASVLGVFGLGQALGNDKVKGFLKEKLGLNVDENRITKFLELIAKGEIWAAIKTLILGAEDAEKIKVTAEYNSLVADKIQKECNLENKINPKLIETISQMTMKDYAASGFSIHGMWEGLKGMMTGLFSKKNPVDEIHEKKIKEYIMNQIKVNKIQYKEDATLASVLLQIIPDTTKTMKLPEEVTSEKGDGVSAGAKVAAGAVGAGVALAGTEAVINGSSQSGKNEVSVGAEPYSVLCARGFQAYYGVFKPWNNMSLIEKQYTKGLWAKIIGDGGKNTDFAKVRGEIGVFKEELNSLVGRTLTQEEAAKAQYLAQKIHAIEKGPKEFKKFVLLTESGAEPFIKNIEVIRESVSENFKSLKGHDSLKSTEFQNFQESHAKYQTMLREKSLLVDDLQGKIRTIDQDILRVSTTQAEKDVLVTQKLKIGAQIKSIEDGVKATTETFIQAEKEFVPLLLKEKNIGRTVLGGWKEFRGVKLDKLDYLKVSPEKQYFRFGSYKGALVLTGVGVAASAYLGKDSNGNVNWEQVKHTGLRIGAGFIPVYGTYLDAKDAYNSLKSRDMMGALANSGAFVASLAGDVLLGLAIAGTAGIGTPVGIEAKAGCGAIRSFFKGFTATAEVAKTAGIAKTAVIAGTAVAIGVGVGVPIASWAMNSSGSLEKTDVSKIDGKEFQESFVPAA